MTTTRRIQWMDFLRGMAIVLVLFWHAPAIPALYGYEIPTWIRAASDFFMPFRMPMLMFLSGMLLSRSLKRRLPEYFLGKLALLGWPYILWSAIHIVQFGNGLSLTSPRSWMATGYLWFLFFIAVYYGLAPFIRWVPSWLVSVAAFIASVPFDGELTKGFFYFLGFFYAGHFLAERHTVLARLTTGWPLVLCAIAAVGVGVWSAAGGQALKYEAFTALGSMAGIIAAMSLADALPASPFRSFVEGVGRKSIVYYVSHFPIIIACMVALRVAGVDSFAVVVIVGFIGSLVAGHLLARWSGQAPVAWLFRLPGYDDALRRIRTADSGLPRRADTLG